MAERQAAVDIEKLVYGGDGLARVEGQIALIPFVLPGERVTTALVSSKSGILRGISPQIQTPSPERVTPGCEYFTACGGCHYQHANYPFQLEQKRAIFLETLQRLGGIISDRDVQVRSGPPWQYRNRIQLHFEERQVGFRRADSHELCPISHCPISSPMLNEVIGRFVTAVKQPQWPDFLRSLEAFTNEAEVQLRVTESLRPVAVRFFDWCGTFLPLAPGPIEYNAAGHTFRVSRGSFFQVNRFLVDSLVDEALGQSSGARAIDLYAGAGLFSLALARRFEHVDAAERAAPAFRDLEWNASRAAPNVNAHKTSAEEFLHSVTETPDLIVADPPRAGLERDTVSELLRIAPHRLTLISCDTATLARDLKKLLPAYGIRKVTIIDLFPQTYHMEAVIQLENAASGAHQSFPSTGH